MIQSLRVGGGGTVSSVFVGQRPASCTVSIVKNDGTTAVVTAKSCTVDPVDTTLSAPAVEGDFSITVTSATGIAVRRRYLLGDEELTIKSVVGSVVNLWAPIERDHASGTAFQGIGVSCVISALEAGASVWWDGQAIFTTGTGDQQTEIVDCVLRPIPDRLISEIDTRKIVPKDTKSLSPEMDLLSAFDDARDALLIDLGGEVRASKLLGVDHLRRLCSYRFWLDRTADFGPEWTDQIKAWREEYDRIMHMVKAEAPQGGDDGSAASGSGTGAYPSIPDLGLA